MLWRPCTSGVSPRATGALWTSTSSNLSEAVQGLFAMSATHAAQERPYRDFSAYQLAIDRADLQVRAIWEANPGAHPT